MAILAFGDSVMKGNVFDAGHYTISNHRFTDIISKKMNVIIENKARFGETVTSGIKQIKRTKCLLQAEYETVMLEYGGNDSDFDWQKISNEPAEDHRSHTALDYFVRTYEEIIAMLRAMKKNVIMLSLPPIDAPQYFAHISTLYGKSNILSWLQQDILFLERWHNVFNMAVFKLAAENNNAIIDITSPFLCKKKYGTCFCADGIHPNEEGHKIIADSIISQIEQSESLRNIFYVA